MNIGNRSDKLEKALDQTEEENKWTFVIVREGETEEEAFARQGAEYAKSRFIVED